MLDLNPKECDIVFIMNLISSAPSPQAPAIDGVPIDSIFGNENACHHLPFKYMYMLTISS